MSYTRIGIFGGGFNPPHNGHVNIALEAKRQLGLDKMLIIPTAAPPHKEASSVELSKRVDMCRLAFDEGLGFEVSDIEGQMTPPNYTINTLRLLKERYAGSEFYLLIGADMLFSFEKWYKYEDILRECNVAAAARSHSNAEQMREFAQRIGNISLLSLDVKEISSSEVRAKLKTGENVSGLIPENVLSYIKERRLYEEH